MTRPVTEADTRVETARAALHDAEDMAREIAGLHGLRQQAASLAHVLAMAARGELPRCESCRDRLATMETADGSAVPTCDQCFADDVAEFGADRTQWRDLPHAAALRAAMEMCR